jgi:L-alanine-DL-glutamate epimerase-like enolase superfamily enzyme
LRADDVEGLADLAMVTDISIAAGENAFDLGDFRTLLMAEAVDIIMPDPTRAGGLSECRRICAMARAWGLRVSPHHYGSDVGFAAALHLLASTPNGDYMLRDVSPTPLREQVLLEPIEIANGYATVPRGPGLGIKLNHEFMAQYTYEAR